MENVPSTFTALEILLMGSLTSVVGGICLLAKFIHGYIIKISKERSEEIHASVKVQTELSEVIRQHSLVIERLPSHMQDKIEIAINKK
jgi:hypothetical protein